MLRPKLNRIWASTSAVTRRDPGDAKYIQGWISEIPTYQVLNYLQYKIDTTLLSLAERGIFEWGNDVQYGLNSLVWDETNQTIYISTVGSPDKTKAPSANPTQWVASSIQVSRASYDSVVANINAHIADIIGNPHGLTAGRLNAYNKAEIDNIVAQYRALVKTHVDDKNNPHGVTALSAGAVPATGGTYSGNVIFNAGVWFDSGKVNGLVKTGGIYLKNGNGQIGISDAGVAQVGKIGALSPIVSEASFPNLKAAQEPNYAVPLPIHAQTLVGDINTYTGMSCAVSNIDPDFIASLGYVLGAANLTNNSFSMHGDVEFTNASGTTIAIDFYEGSGRNADTKDSLLVGIDTPTNNITVLATADGKVRAQRMLNVSGSAVYEGTSSFALPSQIGVWRRLVGVFNGNTVKLFVDGVLVGSNNAATATSTSNNGAPYVSVLNRAANEARTWRVRNFRIWNLELTDKQVSTL